MALATTHTRVGEAAIAEWYGRYGNNVVQLMHLIEFGLLSNLAAVRLPRHELMVAARVDLAGEPPASAGDAAVLPRYRENFFLRDSAAPIALPATVWRLAAAALAIPSTWLHVPCVPTEGLALLHVRSGDVWAYDSLFSRYPFLPIGFHASLIAREVAPRGATRLRIVAEDHGNPLAGALAAALARYLPGLRIDAQIGGSFEETVREIYAAQFIVLTVGTFVNSVALFAAAPGAAPRHIFLLDDFERVYATDMDEYMAREQSTSVHRVPQTRATREYIARWLALPEADRATRVAMMLGPSWDLGARQPPRSRADSGEGESAWSEEGEPQSEHAPAIPGELLG